MRVHDAPTFDIIKPFNRADIYHMARAAQTCYQANFKSDDDDRALIQKLFEMGHESPLEHSQMSVKIIADRGVIDELARHRLASVNVESTRYCNYSNGRFGHELSFVKPIMVEKDTAQYYIWERSCEIAEKNYFNLLDVGLAPENARGVLPLSVKSTIMITANAREWYHIFDLRDSKQAHPDMHYIMHCLLSAVKNDLPEMFEGLYHSRDGEFVTRFLRKETH